MTGRFIILLSTIVLLTAGKSSVRADVLDSLQVFLQLYGTASQEQFGIALANAGDFDGDGYDDLIVGANAYDTPDTNAGAALIFLGGLGADSIPDLILTGTKRSFLGGGVTGLGDFNGDGFDDVAAGAAFYDSSRGRVLVYFGGNPPDTIPDLILQGESQGDNFGVAVCGPGDITGDGWPDLVVGADRVTVDTFENTGRIYIYAGGPLLDTLPDRIISGVTAREQFGFSLANIGDAVGDSFPDLLVGAFSHDVDTSAFNVGRVYLFAGGTALDTFPQAVFTGENSGDLFGWSVAGPGDVNGDGDADILIGAYGFNVAVATEAGKAYILYGGAVLDTLADLTFVSPQAQNLQVGRNVSAAGDLDNDGQGEWLVGSPADDSGKSYLFLAGDADPASPDTVLTGPETLSQFGRAQTDLGNFAGPQSRCFVVGSWAYDTFRGKVTVFCVTADTGGSGCPVSQTCTAIPGDANSSASLTLADIIATVNFIFNKPAWPACASNTAICWLSDLICRGDWNSDCGVTLADIIQGVNYIFNKPGGPWNPAPSGVCCQSSL